MDKKNVLTSEILALMKSWFIEHTSGEDVRTFDFINEKIRKE